MNSPLGVSATSTGVAVRDHGLAGLPVRLGRLEAAGVVAVSDAKLESKSLVSSC
jgi:hypothetical protein